MIDEIKDSGYKVIPIEEYENLKQEIERLNNIINELEKWLYERSEFTNFGVIIDKLQELKGDSSND